MERDRSWIHMIWGGVALVAVVLSAFTSLLALRIDSSPLLSVISSVVTPIITAIYVVSQIHGVRNQMQDVRQDTAEIRNQVNGHMSSLTAKIPDAAPPVITTEGGDV